MGATRLLRVITPGHPSAGPYGSGRSGANCAATEAARYSRSHGQPRLGPQCGGQVTGGGVGVVTNGVGVVMGGVGVVTGGGGLVTGDGGGVVTGDGGVLVTGSGGGVLCSAGGGAVVADSPGSGAVVAGGTAAGAVGDGDGWDASAGPAGVTGPGSAGVVPAGAGVPPASPPVPAAWDWLPVACAGVMPGRSGGMTRSGRPGPSASPLMVAGAVMVTAAPGRACTVRVGAACHSHSATPVVATATVAVGASSHGDSSHPNRSRRGHLTRGPPRRGGTDVVVNQSPNAFGWPAGRQPPESGSGGVTGAAGRSGTGRRRAPAVRVRPRRRRGGSRCARCAGR